MPSLTGKELNQTLKLAAKKPHHYVFAPGKDPESSFMMADKKKLPPDTLKEAKSVTGAKPIRGKCTVEDKVFVFETDKPFTDKHVKILKLFMKKVAKLPQYDIEIREEGAAAQADADKAKAEDGGKQPKDKAAREQRKKERVKQFTEINKEIDRLMKAIG